MLQSTLGGGQPNVMVQGENGFMMNGGGDYRNDFHGDNNFNQNMYSDQGLNPQLMG